MLNASKQAYAQSKHMLGASLEAGVHARLAMLRSRMEACVSLPVRPAACERCEVAGRAGGHPWRDQEVHVRLLPVGQLRGTWREAR